MEIDMEIDMDCAEVATKKSMEISKGNPDFDSSESNKDTLIIQNATRASYKNSASILP
jgi:hypothetical protein